MGTIALAKTPIKGKYIEKYYVCSKCEALFKPKDSQIADRLYMCPNCGLIRCFFKVKWKLKPEYCNPKDVQRLKQMFAIGQPDIIHLGALKLLVEAIEEFQKRR